MSKAKQNGIFERFVDGQVIASGVGAVAEVRADCASRRTRSTRARALLLESFRQASQEALVNHDGSPAAVKANVSAQNRRNRFKDQIEAVDAALNDLKDREALCSRADETRTLTTVFLNRLKPPVRPQTAEELAKTNEMVGAGAMNWMRVRARSGAPV